MFAIPKLNSLSLSTLDYQKHYNFVPNFVFFCMIFNFKQFRSLKQLIILCRLRLKKKTPQHRLKFEQRSWKIIIRHSVELIKIPRHASRTPRRRRRDELPQANLASELFALSLPF